MSDTALPVRKRPPLGVAPSQNPWHDYLDRLRQRAETQGRILKLRAERGDYGDEPEPSDRPLTLTGLVNRREAQPQRRAEPMQPAAAHGPGRNKPCPCGSGRKSKGCCRGKAPEQNSVPAAAPQPQPAV